MQHLNDENDRARAAFNSINHVDGNRGEVNRAKVIRGGGLTGGWWGWGAGRLPGLGGWGAGGCGVVVGGLRHLALVFCPPPPSAPQAWAMTVDDTRPMTNPRKCTMFVITDSSIGWNRNGHGVYTNQIVDVSECTSIGECR